MSLYSEIKKYLLYLVGFFCLLLGAHMAVLYVYKDAITYPIIGGTMNIWIVGESPSLDILSSDTKFENDPNDLVLRFLYRWLASFSLEDKKIVGDLATCTIDAFPNVRCTLNQNALWSDGNSVTVRDVLATYALFREKAHTEATKNRLATVDVSADKGDIIFRFRTTDITVLDILFLPILRQKDIDDLWETANFSTLSFSGPYMFSEKDEGTGVITLKRNPGFEPREDSYFLDQLRFGFWATQKLVKKSLSPDVWLGEWLSVWSEFAKQEYTRPVIYGLYLNTERIPKELRKALLYEVIDPLEYSKSGLVARDNIFLGDIENSKKTTVELSFFQSAFALGYTFWGTATLTIPSPPAVPKYQTLSHIAQPANISPIFTWSETVEILGTAPAGTTKVVVNDYTLQGFVPDKKTFSYRARKDLRNLIDGENTFKVQFFTGAKLLAEEKLTVFYEIDTDKLETIKQVWIEKNTPVIVAPTTNSPVPATDPKKLYDKNGTPLIFHIIAQSDVPVFREAAEKLQTKLQDLAVDVDIEYLSLADIRKMVIEGTRPYDIVFAGVNLGVFHYNILPFFHSGQIKNWLNISRIRSATLDSTMEKLIGRLFYNSPDLLRTIETEIQKVLDAEAVFYPIGSPEEFWYIKKYALWIRPVSFFSGREMLSELIAKSYFKEGYKRSDEPKTVSWFFLWLKNELFTST